MTRMIRIGTRGSFLARVQARWVATQLALRHPDVSIETVVIKTSGDRFRSVAIDEIGGKGVFIKEIEDALLKGEIDLAVHSMKDLPTENPRGLALVAVPPREDPSDVLISNHHIPLAELEPGARVGTGSLRRRAQLLHFRPDLEVVPIRGNVDTRLRKMQRGAVDAVVLASAGLRRIGWEKRITEILPGSVCLSAPGQGALGVQGRLDDPISQRIAFLNDERTALEVKVERAFLSRLQGGCQVPVGARAVVSGAEVELQGLIAEEDGMHVFRGQQSGPVAYADRIATDLAERLLLEGGRRVLFQGRRSPQGISEV